MAENRPMNPNNMQVMVQEQQPVEPQRPRVPHNLYGLLRFAMESTKADDPTGPSQFAELDDEKRKFLEEVLKSMTVDVAKVLSENIDVLKNTAGLSVESDISDYIAAFDSIVDLIDNIDIACDFHKIGGYQIFDPCFNCVHGEIRARACDLLAELCQNNPYCQEYAIKCGFMKTLLELLDNDSEINVNVKALYAVSSLTRNNPATIDEFKRNNGIASILASMTKENTKLITKASFLLGALCSENVELKDIVLEQGGPQLFVSLLAQEHHQSHEHLLSLLLTLVKDHSALQAECKRPEYALKTILESHLILIGDKEETEEERNYCHSLLKLLFTEKLFTAER